MLLPRAGEWAFDQGETQGDGGFRLDALPLGRKWRIAPMPNRIYGRLSQNWVSMLDFHSFHLAIFPDQYIEDVITLYLAIQCLPRTLGPDLLF